MSCKCLCLKLFAVLCVIFWGCSEEKTAGGVTDIGNSIAGNVFFADGKTPAAGARVVAYEDFWKSAGIVDSMETVADSMGRFEFNGMPYGMNLIFAASGSANLLTGLVEDSMRIVLGESGSLKGSISEMTEGTVRIVGTHLSASLDSAGAFAFDSVPAGNLSLVYVQNGISKAHFDFCTEGDSANIELPDLKILGEADSILVVSDIQKDSGIQVSSAELLTVKLTQSPGETLYGFVLPVKFNDKIDFERFSSPDSFKVVSETGSELPFEVDYWTPPVSQGVLWVRLDSLPKGASEVNLYLIPREFSQKPAGMQWESDSVLAALHLNGDAEIFNPSDSDKAFGIIGYGATISQGQSVSLDSIDPFHSDFTLSAWVYWNGDNGNHQILFAKRASWADSTFFEWYYETNSKSFSVYDGESLDSLPGAVAAFDTLKWNLLALVSKNDSISMFKNGERIGEPIYFKLRESGMKVPLRAGGNDIAEESWNGSLDEIHVSARALSAEWLRMEYETQNAARN